MQFESTRFGELEIAEDAILAFPDGLIGLEGRLWSLVVYDEDSPFLWLQSLEHAEIALPVTTPWLFFPSYDVRVPDEDAEKLGDPSADEVDVLCVVKAAPSVDEFTVNRAAPILLNRSSRIGRQIINDAGGYSVRHPLFAEVELGQARPAASPLAVAATAV
jgi:flagellar assembly factor FliW